MKHALVLALLLLPPSAAADDWPQVTGPSGDRRTADTFGPAALVEPQIAWRVKTDSGFSSFAVVGERALTLVEREGKECCLALNAADGAELWSRDLGQAAYDGGGGRGTKDNDGGDGPRGTPVIVGERVYVYDAHLVLTCLELATGKVVWRVDVQADHEGRQIHWQNASDPVVVDGVVLIAGGGAEQTMLGFEAASGEVLWGHGDDHLTHATPVVASLHGVQQVIYYLRGGLTAVAPKTGEVLWSFEYPFRTSSAASPVVYEDLVYVSAGYGVGAGVWRIDRAEDGTFTPEFLWRQRAKLQNHWSTPVCKDGFLYGMFSFKKYGQGPLKCIELATGEEQWSTDGFGPGNAILAGEHLIALSDAGEVVVIEATPESYNELARAEVLDGKCWSSPALAGDQLYLRSTVEGVRLDLSGSAR